MDVFSLFIVSVGEGECIAFLSLFLDSFGSVSVFLFSLFSQIQLGRVDLLLSFHRFNLESECISCASLFIDSVGRVGVFLVFSYIHLERE